MGKTQPGPQEHTITKSDDITAQPRPPTVSGEGRWSEVSSTVRSNMFRGNPADGPGPRGSSAQHQCGADGDGKQEVTTVRTPRSRSLAQRPDASLGDEMKENKERRVMEA